MRKKAYVFMLTNDDRKRHEHVSEKGEVKGFIVQFETKINDKWMPVVRYDTSHGFAHKDIINPDGSKEKILLGEVSYDELLTEADKDINENWEEYKKRYLRRMKNG